ncbi:lanthionine synthetase LanC family protein [Chryseobacterium sp. NFX27]|uniref:lanthionine synthetase LanC family protein n=1 Tax=Chryseobacterium sp. NFX27 TaxID=2819618 RepID=UPI003CF041CF
MEAEKYYSSLKVYFQNNEPASLSTGLNGRCAIAIFMFEYYRVSSDIEAYNYGTELVETELNEINLIHNVSLFDGLCGIAWTVQYLSKEKMIDLNADSYLSQYIEKHLEKFRDSHINFNHPLQLEYFSDLLFYFSERMFYTRKKLQKENYLHILNQTLIILYNQFIQIEKYSSQQNISLESLFPVIRSCVYVSETNFKSPLINTLLQKALLWIKDRKIHQIQTTYEQFILKKAVQYASSSHRGIEKFTSEFKPDENVLKKEENTFGIWNNSLTNSAIRNISELNAKKHPGLKCILESTYNY